MNYKKLWISLFTLCLFCFPLNVFAKEPIADAGFSCTTRNISVSVCNSAECDASDLENVFSSLMSYRNSCSIDNLTINIGEGYYYVDYFDMWDIDKLTIKGSGKEKTVIRTDSVSEYYRINDVKISDLTLKRDDGSRVFEVYDSGDVYLSNLLVDARNTDIGIELSHNDTVKTNGVVVRNAKVFGIYNNRCMRYPTSSENNQFFYSGSVQKKILTIENSDISNNSCGVLDGCLELETDQAIEQAFEPVAKDRMLTYDYDTTVISKSKIACAVAYGRDYEYDPPSIYIKSNNTWIEKPIYGENVIEAYDGRVIVDLEEDKTISLSKKDNLVIESIFDDVDSDIEWVVEDERIAKVENGKIIPLKVGKTILTATNGSINYKINLVVTNNLLNNPNTLNISYILIVLLVSGVIGRIIYKKNYSK